MRALQNARSTDPEPDPDPDRRGNRWGSVLRAADRVDDCETTQCRFAIQTCKKSSRNKTKIKFSMCSDQILT